MEFGNMTMDEYEKNILELLKYVDFIKDEKVKIQCFLNGLPTFYRDSKIFNRPRTLEGYIEKEKITYEKNKGKVDLHKTLKGIVQDKKDQ